MLFSSYHLLLPFRSYLLIVLSFFFFFNDTATTEIYTLSLHDALPISSVSTESSCGGSLREHRRGDRRDRKSTRLNSSHSSISYAVFCLKTKKKTGMLAHRMQIKQVTRFDTHNKERD